jgi:hypothetical protein
MSSMRSMHLCVGVVPSVARAGAGAFCAFYALGFFFRDRGPLQKVCRDPDTGAVGDIIHMLNCTYLQDSTLLSKWQI